MPLTFQRVIRNNFTQTNYDDIILALTLVFITLVLTLHTIVTVFWFYKPDCQKVYMWNGSKPQDGMRSHFCGWLLA